MIQRGVPHETRKRRTHGFNAVEPIDESHESGRFVLDLHPCNSFRERTFVVILHGSGQAFEPLSDLGWWICEPVIAMNPRPLGRVSDRDIEIVQGVANVVKPSSSYTLLQQFISSLEHTIRQR